VSVTILSADLAALNADRLSWNFDQLFRIAEQSFHALSLEHIYQMTNWVFTNCHLSQCERRYYLTYSKYKTAFVDQCGTSDYTTGLGIAQDNVKCGPQRCDIPRAAEQLPVTNRIIWILIWGSVCRTEPCCTEVASNIIKIAGVCPSLYCQQI